MAFTHSTKTASVAAVDCKDFDCVFVTATGAITVYLPAPSDVPVGSRRIIKKVSSTGAVTVQSTNGATIDGAASYSLATQWKFVDAISDGAQWLVVGSN